MAGFEGKKEEEEEEVRELKLFPRQTQSMTTSPYSALKKPDNLLSYCAGQSSCRSSCQHMPSLASPGHAETVPQNPFVEG